MLFVFSANSKKFIKMNIKESAKNESLILDGNNLSVKIGLIGDYVKLFKLDAKGNIEKIKEIEAAIAKDFYGEGIENFFKN